MPVRCLIMMLALLPLLGCERAEKPEPPPAPAEKPKETPKTEPKPVT